MVEITLSGPGKNALGSEMMDFVIGSLADANGAPVLLRGAGDAFCAGLNLKELAGLDASGIEAYLRKLERLVEAIWLYPGPTVAWLNGHAIAGGSVIALCCDHIVSRGGTDMKIGLNEIALGLRFPPVTLAMVLARLGPQHVNEVILGARLYDPIGALRLGLVDELCDDDAGDPVTAQARLSWLGAHPLDNYAATKHRLRSEALAAAKQESTFTSILPIWTGTAFRERLARALKK